MAAERAHCSGGDFCGLGGAYLGGHAGAVFIDSAVLGYARVLSPRQQLAERWLSLPTDSVRW